MSNPKSFFVAFSFKLYNGQLLRLLIFQLQCNKENAFISTSLRTDK